MENGSWRFRRTHGERWQTVLRYSEGGGDIFSGNNCYIFVIDSLFYLVTNVHINYNVTDSGS